MSLVNEIDLCIIIPAYNCIDTIEMTLDSIVMQELFINYEVVLVDDCSSYDYDNVLSKYKKKINIREIKTPKNVGPGGARQYGIDNSSSNYIVFIDSDDCFYDKNSLCKMYNEIKNRNADLIIGNFIYERDNKVLVRQRNLTWLHGKIYRRKFFVDNGIRFNETRANEDNGFNRLVLLLEPVFYFLDEIVYVYKENPNSITRKDDRLYRFYGLEGFCYNMNWAMDEASKRGKSKVNGILSLDILVALYLYYLDLQYDYDVSKILVWARDIYNKYKIVEDNFSKDDVLNLINEKKDFFKDDVNIREYNIDFYEFLNMVECV